MDISSLFGWSGSKSKGDSKPVYQDDAVRIVLTIVGSILGACVSGVALGCFYLRKRKLQLRCEKDFELEKKVCPLFVGGFATTLLILSESGLCNTGFGKIVLFGCFILSAMCLGMQIKVVTHHLVVRWNIESKSVLFRDRYASVSWICVACFYVLVAMAYWPIMNAVVNNRAMSLLFSFLSFQLGCFGLTLCNRKLLGPLFFGDDGRVTSKSLEVEVQWSNMKEAFADPKRAPIGISMLTGEVTYLEEEKRLEHSLFAGATGSGKSTILKTLVAHAILHDKPVIIIDQKGDGSLFELFRTFAKSRGKDPGRIVKFSLADMEGSAKYNPLRHGTAGEIKDRIMGAFKWSESYYETLAARVLSMILPCFDAVGAIPTLKAIRDIMVVDEIAELLKKNLVSKQMDAEKNGSSDLTSFISGCLNGLEQVRGMNKKELQGLLAQLDILANIETGKLLSPKPKDAQIDFDQVILKKQVVIFELPAANGDQSRRIGRMILGHLKSYMALIESKRKPRPDFLPIFIDEFGAYADENFSDFLKQARSARMAIHCFFQSRGDLIQVSPSFEMQMMDNTVYKGVLRQDHAESAEHWAKTAGTQDAVERSYQVGRMFGAGVRTGMGNERLTKQMRVEHDVFKELNKFQMILIEKNPRKLDVVSLWTGAFRNFEF